MQRNKEKANSLEGFGPNTNTIKVQAQPRTHQPKAVARQATQGAAALGVRPHPHATSRAHLWQGGNTNAQEVSLPTFLIYLTQTDHEALYKKKLSPSINNNTQVKSTKEKEKSKSITHGLRP